MVLSFPHMLLINASKLQKEPQKTLRVMIQKPKEAPAITLNNLSLRICFWIWTKGRYENMIKKWVKNKDITKETEPKRRGTTEKSVMVTGRFDN